MEDKVLRHFRLQADACERLHSPFMAQLLRLVADNLHWDHPVFAKVRRWDPDRVKDDALALRIAGGLHALVLSGRAAELATVYPPAETSNGELLYAIKDAITAHESYLLHFLTFPPQTNEVGRSAALAAGFQVVHQETGLPLRMLELGASAGLNLKWDSFRIDYDGARWGAETSRVHLQPQWTGDRPPLVPVPVAERQGCDLSPLDVGDDDLALRLRSYVWADQLDRRKRLEAAIELARTSDRKVAAASAEKWTRQQLANLPSGVTTVLYHSVFWQYLPDEKRAALSDAIEDAGRRASADAPFAHLALEPDRDQKQQAALYLTLWPGGRERKLAEACYHGRWVRWSGG